MLLMEQSKMASMGEMVGSIAHQWRQPLNSIGFILQDMISAYRHNEFDEEYLKEVKKEMMEQLNYMSETIDEFRNYFKKDEPYRQFNLIRSVQDVNKLYRSQLTNYHLSLELTIEGKKLAECSKEEIDAFDVTNQESQLKQVLINCITNAKDAIIEHKEPHNKQKIIGIELTSDQENMLISVNDLAGGINPKNLQRIFEPYFTTKNMGTGLGLYICRMICKKSLNGDIRYQQNEIIIDGKKVLGSKLIISIPKNS